MKLCYYLLFLFLFVACNKEETVIPDQSFVEEFSGISSAEQKGWRFINSSSPANNNKGWQGGSVSGELTAYSPRGSFFGFITTDFTATSARPGTISDWAISPSVIFQNGDKIVFFTRALLYAERNELTDHVNRMQLRLNTHNDTTIVGQGTSVGDFDQLLLDINPGYDEYSTDPSLKAPTAYPPNWTRFEGTISGLAAPTKGRFAFRYFLEGGGANGYGGEIGLDSVAYVGR